MIFLVDFAHQVVKSHPIFSFNIPISHTKGSKKRKKKRKAEGTAPKDNTAKSSSGSTTGACIEVMAASVYAVEAILKQPGSSLLPPKSLYLVETTVISLLKTIQKSLGTESGGGAAWDNPAGDLRLALYKLLVTRAISGAAREESEEGHGIGGGTGAGGRGGFLLAAAAAFEEGQKSDPNLGIADFCGRCLNACEVVIHPRLPPHLAPAPLPPLHSRMLATGVVESSVPSSWSPEELLASFFSAAATTSHKRSWIGGDPVTTSRHRTPAPLSINNNNSKLAHSATTSYDMTNRAKEKESETDRDKERTKEVERATEREKARSSGSGNKGKNDPMVVDQKRASHVRHHAEDGVRPLLLKLLHGEEDRKGQTPEVMQVESATPVPSQATKSAEGEEGRAEEEEDNHVRYDKWSVKEVPSFSPAAEEGGPSTTMVIVEKRSQSAGGGTVGEKNITKKHGAEEEEGDEDIPDIVDASPDTSDDEGKGL